MKTIRLGCVAFLLLTLAFAGEAAAQFAIAEMGGAVTDPDGEALPGVVVTATHLATGTVQVSISLVNGSFIMKSLRTGMYEVKAELTGFSTIIRAEVPLSVGQRLVLNFQMSLASVEETITIVAETPLIDAKKSNLGGVIDQSQIQGLPLNGRDWKELALLAPGAKSIGGRRDKPSAGIGSGGYHTKIFVDGAEADNQCCPIVLNINISQDAVDEFQVLTNRFDASYGKAGALIVNAKTKGGTNAWHGGGLFFFRDDSLNAEDHFTGEVEDFRHTQVGVNIGGPIIQNKSFIYFNFERHNEPSTRSSNTGIPSFDVSNAAGINRKFWVARWDHQFNSNHRLFFRGSIFDELLMNLDYGPRRPLQGGLDRPLKTESWTFGYASVLSDNIFNDFRLNVLSNQFDNQTYVIYPELNFPSVQLGSPTNQPSRITDFVIDVRNDFSYYKPTSWGVHDMKLGVEVDYTHDGGIFAIFGRGQFSFASDPPNIATCCLSQDPTKWDTSQFPDPTLYVVGLGANNVDVGNTIYSTYFQNDWSVTDRLTLNLGIRYDLEYGILGEDFRTQPEAAVARNRDYNNFAPRLGFAYDLTGTGTTILRGGAGTYYDQVYLAATFIQQIFNGVEYVIAVIPNDGLPGFFDDPLRGRTLADFVGPDAAPTTFSTLSPDMKNPQNQSYSIGVAHEFGRNWAIEADFVHQKGVDHPYRADSNLFCCTADGFPLPVAEFGRPDPKHTSIDTYYSTLRALYDGLQVGVKKRFADKYQLGITYLLSRHKDQSGNPYERPNNPFDLEDEYATSRFDQRHRLVVNWLYQLPYDIWFNGIFLGASGSALPANSGGRDVNGDQTGTGDRPSCNSSIPGCAVLGIPDGQLVPRNPYRTDAIVTVDLRISKGISVGAVRVEPIFEVFNLFNRENHDADRYIANVFSSRFGTPSRSQALGFQSRQMQLGIRIMF